MPEKSETGIERLAAQFNKVSQLTHVFVIYCFISLEALLLNV